MYSKSKYDDSNFFVRLAINSLANLKPNYPCSCVFSMHRSFHNHVFIRTATVQNKKLKRSRFRDYSL